MHAEAPDPAVSVVVPAYDASRTVDATVRSILAQTRRDFELIVVDDGSSDDTPLRIEGWSSRDPRVRLVRQENQGTAAARNTGIAEATAPLVAFLDNDDLWMPGYLAGMTTTLDAAPDASFAYADAWLFDELSGRIRKLTSLQHYRAKPSPRASAEEVLLALIEANFVMSSTTVRADALAETGGFDSAIRGADDWDLWIRLVATGRRAVLAPGCLIVQRDRADSLSKDEAMMLRNMQAVLRAVLVREDIPESARELARAKLSEHERHLERVEAGGPIRAARALVARGRLARKRLTPRLDWRPEPPAEVAEAFPELARDYGRPLSNDW